MHKPYHAIAYVKINSCAAPGKTGASDQILTLIAFPFFFVIQCITVDDVFSNHLISGDNLVSNKPIARRSVGLTDALSSSKVILGDGVVSNYLVSSG